MAEKIRIDDLRAPVLTDVQRAALAYGEKQHGRAVASTPCSPRRSKRTGLDDFGPDDFRERLALWLAEVDEDPRAHRPRPPHGLERLRAQPRRTGCASATC